MPNALDRKVIRVSPVILRIREARSRGAEFLRHIRGFFRDDQDDLVFLSALGAGHSIDEHLKWIFGMVEHDSAVFRRAQQNGYEIVLQVFSESRSFTVSPEAFFLPHKLHLPVAFFFLK